MDKILDFEEFKEIKEMRESAEIAKDTFWEMYYSILEEEDAPIPVLFQRIFICMVNHPYLNDTAIEFIQQETEIAARIFKQDHDFLEAALESSTYMMTKMLIFIIYVSNLHEEYDLFKEFFKVNLPETLKNKNLSEYDLDELMKLQMKIVEQNNEGEN